MLQTGGYLVSVPPAIRLVSQLRTWLQRLYEASAEHLVGTLIVSVLRMTGGDKISARSTIVTLWASSHPGLLVSL